MLDSSTAPPRDASLSETAEDAQLAAILESCLVEIESGRPVDPERLAAEHPAIGERLATCVQTLNLIHQAASRADARPGQEDVVPAGRLGDFDILREVGRGGMGVVYEARQVSLGRRVALKVLPFAATLDPRQLQRFWTEAQAAAILHHAHIVPVYSVGCERGVHYYAMQFIEGQSLAQVIGNLRSHRPDPTQAASAKIQAGHHPERAGAANATMVALTTERSAAEPAYFRAIARLGVQAARALEHAHQLGVVHRDIKPANLLVDSSGELWITDFGLARVRAHAGLTLTGDAVGTLRYMSPEQALAKGPLVDHRTDIYSLGSTLYEALTLQAAYPGDDREQILQQIARSEPSPLRRVNPLVPFDLETIVLKAMAREAERRYATAQELADDLERFLEHRPVKAVRPRLGERLTKWGWRHRAILGAVTAVAALATLGLLLMTILLWREQSRTQNALELARAKEKEAERNRDRAEANFQKALAGLNRLLWELEEPRWNKIPGFAGARRELTRQSLQIFEDFVENNNTDAAIRFQAARAYEKMVIVYLVDKKYDKADATHDKAVALFEKLQSEFPENTEYARVVGRAHTTMGKWKTSLKDRRARQEYQHAEQAYQRALAFDQSGLLHDKLAFLLCDCQVRDLRDAKRALRLSEEAVSRSPKEAEFWKTRALAHYRNNDWAAARSDLQESMRLSAGGDAYHWLLLAMIGWQQGDRQQARVWYDRAAEWLERNPLDDALYHVRREAAILVGIHWP